MRLLDQTFNQGLFLALAAWQGSKKAAAEAKAEMYTRNYGVLYKVRWSRLGAQKQDVYFCCHDRKKEPNRAG